MTETFNVDTYIDKELDELKKHEVDLVYEHIFIKRSMSLSAGEKFKDGYRARSFDNLVVYGPGWDFETMEPSNEGWCGISHQGKVWLVSGTPELPLKQVNNRTVVFKQSTKVEAV